MACAGTARVLTPLVIFSLCTKVAPQSGEARKLEVASFPDMNLPVNKPATFTIVTHGAKGKLDAKVIRLLLV